MGQTTSHPVSESHSDEPRSVGRALRRVVSDRQHTERAHDQDGLLNDEQLRSGGSRSSRRARRSNTNRLSQMFGRREDDTLDTDSHTASDSNRSPILQRTRSHLNHILRRDGPRPSPFSLRPTWRNPFHASQWSGVTEERDAHTGRPLIPSTDPSAPFDTTFAPQQPFSQIPSDPEVIHSESFAREEYLRGERGDRRFHAPQSTSNPIIPTLRQFTSSFRRRRSRPSSMSSLGLRGNEDQAAMLSRLLSVAAAATAATLMGNNDRAIREARSLISSTGLGDLASGGEDGSFVGFLEALENGRIASVLRQGAHENSTEEDGAAAPPLNFFRMFRFGAAEPTPAVQRNMGASDAAEHGRMVPIIIVGIRSITQGANSNAAALGDDLPPFIDALGNMAAPLAPHELDTHGHDTIDAILRPPQNGTSFRHRRRASMGGFGIHRHRFNDSRINDRMDDQRDHRSPDRRRERPWSIASSSSFGPRPPPATRSSSPGLDTRQTSRRNSTASRSRPASFVASSSSQDVAGTESARNSLLNRSSLVSPLSSHTEETASLHSTHSGTNLLADLESFRAHRRSETAPNIHYPRFASGHPRRNGVVEPDNLRPLSRTSTRSRANSHDSAREGDARSWIIYVLGGSYPENHPILTTPSLFTENPTYEDMMLLSALLGPAKAPVATEEDVQNAGGIYDIVAVADAPTPEAEGVSGDAAKTAELVAIATTPTVDASKADSTETVPPDSAPLPERIYLEPGQRCLVCISEFEAAEVGRKLAKCNHFFHQECIDQWLTTGRNSCPLCREEGVTEKKTNATSSTETEVTDAAGPESAGLAGIDATVLGASSSISEPESTVGAIAAQQDVISPVQQQIPIQVEASAT